MARNYEVIGQKVIADVAKLNAKELAAVKNYIALGYELFERVKPEKEAKEEWKQDYFEKWLEENGTEEQKKKYKAIISKPVIDKKTGETKLLKSGKVKTVGYAAAFNWIKETWENYPSVD